MGLRSLRVVLAAGSLLPAAALLFPAAALVLACSAETPLPNIVVIVADDLGYGDVSAYGGALRTPNIDRLGREGVRFTDAYVTSAVCRPSRVGLLTGRYQQRQGSDFGPAARGGLRSASLAEALAPAGYTSGFVGKWHVGTVRGERPLDRGFDEFFGFLERSLYANPDARGVRSWELRLGPRQEPMPIFRNEDRVEESAFLTHALTREAVGFIEARGDAPFLLVLSYGAPHVPLQATEEDLARQHGTAPLPHKIYGALVTALDDGVGAVLEALERRGIAERTLVVFLSDNGCPSGGDGGCSNAPFSGGKRDLSEGGVRVPFAMRWSDRLPAGVTYRKPVSSLDVFATAVAAARAPAPDQPLDGVDLVPFLADLGVQGSGPDAPGRSPHAALHWRVGPNAAVRQGRWKLARYNRPAPAALERAARPDSYEVPASPRRPVTLLFDLEEDPGEQRDVSAEHPDVVGRLEALAADWERELPPPRLKHARATLREVAGLWVEMIF